MVGNVVLHEHAISLLHNLLNLGQLCCLGFEEVSSIDRSQVSAQFCHNLTEFVTKTVKYRHMILDYFCDQIRSNCGRTVPILDKQTGSMIEGYPRNKFDRDSITCAMKSIAEVLRQVEPCQYYCTWIHLHKVRMIWKIFKQSTHPYKVL